MDKLWITIIVLFLLNIFQSYLLFKKPTTENNTENNIEKLFSKIKGNKGSSIDMDVDVNQEQETPKKERKRLFKRKSSIN